MRLITKITQKFGKKRISHKSTSHFCVKMPSQIKNILTFSYLNLCENQNKKQISHKKFIC